MITFSDVDQKNKQHIFKPKNYKWPPKRPKTLKQLIIDEQKRQSAELESLKAEGKDIAPYLNRTNYLNVDAGPSLRPHRKYCDITGLEGKYTYPGGSKIQYHNAEVYGVIKTLPPGIDQAYLALRSAHFVLK